MEKKSKKKSLFLKPTPEKAPQTNEQPGGIPGYLRFTGLAFEMVAVIGLAIVAGYYIDQYLSLRFPVFILTFTLLALGASMYLLYKRLPKS